jgi:hypothetical protein
LQVVVLLLVALDFWAVQVAVLVQVQQTTGVFLVVQLVLLQQKVLQVQAQVVVVLLLLLELLRVLAVMEFQVVAQHKQALQAELLLVVLVVQV